MDPKEKQKSNNKRPIIECKFGCFHTERQTENCDCNCHYTDPYIELLQDWVKWNKKKINGDEFAVRFKKCFHKDCEESWEDEQKKK